MKIKEKEALLQNISKLAARLRQSGKEETASFYDSLFTRIKKAKNNSELKEIAEEIYRSYKIVDLANFSHEEENIFDDIFQCAETILKKI